MCDHPELHAHKDVAVAVKPATPTLVSNNRYLQFAGIQIGTLEGGLLRFGRDTQNGQPWLVIDQARTGSQSGRSFNLTRETARVMRDALNALLEG